MQLQYLGVRDDGEAILVPIEERSLAPLMDYSMHVSSSGRRLGAGRLQARIAQEGCPGKVSMGGTPCSSCSLKAECVRLGGGDTASCFVWKTHKTHYSSEMIPGHRSSRHQVPRTDPCMNRNDIFEHLLCSHDCIGHLRNVCSNTSWKS